MQIPGEAGEGCRGRPHGGRLHGKKTAVTNHHPKKRQVCKPPNKWLLKQDLQPTGTRAQLLRTTENLGKPGAVISIPAAISWQWCKGSLKQRSGWQGHMAQQPGGAWATGRERAMQQVGSEAKNTTGASGEFVSLSPTLLSSVKGFACVKPCRQQAPLLGVHPGP